MKLELHDLRKKVKALPELLSQEMDKTTKLTDQFGSMKMSNMEGTLGLVFTDIVNFFMNRPVYMSDISLLGTSLRKPEGDAGI